MEPARVHLASASSRRAEILASEFEDLAVELTHAPLSAVEREGDSALTVQDQVFDVLDGKVEAAIDELYDDLADLIAVLVSDTLVESPTDSHIALGQPRDGDEAREMLSLLSGKTHKVWTGSSILSWQDGSVSVSGSVVSAEVSVKRLSEAEIDGLVESRSWVGKAGAYDLAGAMGEYASIVEGEESTVLGFTPEVLDILRSSLGESVK